MRLASTEKRYQVAIFTAHAYLYQCPISYHSSQEIVINPAKHTPKTGPSLHFAQGSLHPT